MDRLDPRNRAIKFLDHGGDYDDHMETRLYCEKLKEIIYESTSLNRIVTDKSDV